MFLKEASDVEDVKMVVHRGRGTIWECDFPTAESFGAFWRHGSETL